MFREKTTIQTPADKMIQALSLSFSYTYKAYVYMPVYMYNNWHCDGGMMNV